jgi:hypothetical protein
MNFHFEDCFLAKNCACTTKTRLLYTTPNNNTPLPVIYQYCKTNPLVILRMHGN